MFYDLLTQLNEKLIFIFAYGLSVTLIGALTAWTAKKAGDPTADHAGFTSLDPLVHIDFLGLMCMMALGFGWGRKIPINARNITAPLRDLKLLLVYYIEPIAHIFLSSVAMLALSAQQMLILHFEPNSKLLMMLGLMAGVTLALNVVLAVFRFIQNSVSLLSLPLLEQNPELEIYIDLGSLLATLILILFLGDHIKFFFLNLSHLLAVGLASLFFNLNS